MSDQASGCELLERSFERVSTAIVAALRAAYDTAAELHDADRGSNEHTYGYGVYHYAVHEISNSPEVEAGQIYIVSKHPSFRLRIGEFEAACHRVPAGDIWTSFPSNNGAVGEMVEGQLWIPGFEPVPTPDANLHMARRVLIAHMGDLDEGLRAVYACIPTSVNEAGQIDRWGYAKLLWSSDGGGRSERVEHTETVPDETVERIPVRRKRRSDVNGD